MTNESKDIVTIWNKTVSGWHYQVFRRVDFGLLFLKDGYDND